MALKHYLNLCPGLKSDTVILLRLAELALSPKWFSFVATRMDRKYVKLCVHYVVAKIVSQYTYLTPKLYGPYIDDK